MWMKTVSFSHCGSHVCCSASVRHRQHTVVLSTAHTCSQSCEMGKAKWLLIFQGSANDSTLFSSCDPVFVQLSISELSLHSSSSWLCVCTNKMKRTDAPMHSSALFLCQTQQIKNSKCCGHEVMLYEITAFIVSWYVGNPIYCISVGVN